VGTGFTGGEHRSACHRSVWPVAGALRITGRRVGNVRLLKTSSILLFTPITLGSIAGPCTPATDFEEGELAQARNDGIDIERASTTWSTSSFTSYHGQLLSLAVQWGVAIEIERAIKKNASF
jgi:hypothetical protein